MFLGSLHTVLDKIIIAVTLQVSLQEGHFVHIFYLQKDGERQNFACMARGNDVDTETRTSKADRVLPLYTLL